MNVVLLRGRLSRAPQRRALPSGDELVGYDVTVRRPGQPAESVPVAWFDAPASATELAADDEVVVVGRVRRRFFRRGGATQSRTEVVAERVVPCRQRVRVGRMLSDALALAADQARGGD
ncbi:MAG TPA: single-stranded DNA-binding protein [Acidimicrobiales bacterium]|nr:single-stranded DNA-binding protein [Acidimicrobiales bacterium]